MTQAYDRKSPAQTPVGMLDHAPFDDLIRGPDDRAPHYFTVDVEEYFQVSALESAAPRARWDTYESRVEGSTREILQLLGEAGATGTFFILGWVAERKPELVRDIAEAGHEIASHGWDHRRIPTQTRAEFRSSVRRSRQLLQEITGRDVVGFRAPSFSIHPGHEWALDVLIEEGYLYDSSLFPVRRPGYGYPNTPRVPYRVRRSGGDLLEFPPATLRRLGFNIPAGGGAYLRLFPAAVIRSAVRELEKDGHPATLYIHPWELDSGQPRMRVSTLTRIRHYGGLRRTRPRLERLLKDFRFTSILSTLDLS